MESNAVAEIVFCISIFLIAWTYLVYPFVIRLLKPYYKPIKKKSGHFPSFSIIVPSYNEERVIGKKLENLLSLDYPKHKVQIIVVDDGSTDNTSEIIQKFEGMTIIKSKRVGKTEAINQGLRKASGEIVLVTDADCFFEKDALIQAAEVLSDESIGAVTGNIELLDCEPSFIPKDFSSIFNGLLRYESLLDSVPTGMGSFLAFKRKLVENLNTRCLADDVEISICVRMQNLRVVDEPQIKVRTWDPNIFGSWYKQSVRRTLQGLTTLFQYKSVLFNPKYKWYGALILPTRLLLHRLTPFFLITALLASFFIDPIFSLTLAAITMIAVMFVPRLRKMFVIQLIFLNAWVLFLFRGYELIWERGPRTSSNLHV